MRTKKCEKCGEKFEIVENNGDGFDRPTSTEIECPSCKDVTYEKSTGYFVTKKLPRR
jgi:DNA-directed RNA polymerase subunit RPC12/RpoP